ncbi:MAG: FliA/WhiG family RNA polymerase sigma factor [SAR324 cluster bacterium]|nr:FliA/WhiG family RNA polymerase sigma factor [SAR324 cluster bacterium]
MNNKAKVIDKRTPYHTEFKRNKLELVKKYAPLVKRIAGLFSLRLPPYIDKDDLEQVGMIGLLESINRYDPNAAANFKTYAEYRIRGAMLDELRARDWIPRSVKTSASKLDKAHRSLRKKGIDRPNHADLAKEMEMEINEFEHFLSRNISMPLLSLDSLGKSFGNDHVEILDIIVNPDETLADEDLVKKEINNKLANAIAKLPKRTQLVLSLSYQKEMNLKEISKVLDLTEARICQIRTSSISFLRSYLSKDKDKDK